MLILRYWMDPAPGGGVNPGEPKRMHKSALILSKVFPPLTAVGGQRPAGLACQLVRRGWKVTVVTARSGDSDRVDDRLLNAVPPEVRVLRTAAPDLPLLAARLIKRRRIKNRKSAKNSDDIFSDASKGEVRDQDKSQLGFVNKMVDWLSWWLHVPDSCTGWLVPALWTGSVEMLRGRINVIYSTGPVWTSHLAATILSRISNVPLITDFRDPWCGSPFHNIPYGAHRWMNDIFENMVIRRSSRILCAWEGIRNHLIQRYPRRVEDIVTVLNGFRREVVNRVKPEVLAPDRRVLVHAGSFYGPRSPIPILVAMKWLKERMPLLAERIVVVFLGPTTYGPLSLTDLAADYGVAGHFHVIPPVPYERSLALLKGADVAMLFGQSGCESLASVPAKAYDYIGLNRSVLAIGAGREACRVMEEGGCEVHAVSSDDVEGIANALARIAQGSHVTRPDHDARLNFTQERMALRIEQQLIEVVQESKRKNRSWILRGRWKCRNQKVDS